MNNELIVRFDDNKEATYHIAVGCRIKEVIEEIEQEESKKVIAFNWIRIFNEWEGE